MEKASFATWNVLLHRRLTFYCCVSSFCFLYEQSLSVPFPRVGKKRDYL
jgi:hypothetical protein